MSDGFVCEHCGSSGPGPSPLHRADASTQTESPDMDSNQLLLALQQELAWAQRRLQEVLKKRKKTTSAGTQTMPSSPVQDRLKSRPAQVQLSSVKPALKNIKRKRRPRKAPLRRVKKLENESGFQTDDNCYLPRGPPDSNTEQADTEPLSPESSPLHRAEMESPSQLSTEDPPMICLQALKEEDESAAFPVDANDSSLDGDHDFELPTAGSGRGRLSSAESSGSGWAQPRPGLPHPCPQCGEAFRTAQSLRRHQIRHTEDKPLSCSRCDRRFRHPSTLRGHEAAAHGLGRAHACPQCGKAFPSRRDLREHVRTHTGERPHACSLCDRRFAQLGNLRVHERAVHLRERPHLCDTCGRAFSVLDALQQHVRRHTGERPFVCEDCGRAFRHRVGLTQHSRTHSDDRPYACEVCGRAFKTPTALSGHRKTHSGERPYACGTCGSAFARKTSLEQHKLTHTGERPHVCGDCGRAFTRSSRLTEHRRLAHGQLGQVSQLVVEPDVIPSSG